jgi:uncharacterized membrane protein YhaH (DUF805 family)
MRLLFTTQGRIPRHLWWSGIGTLVVYHVVTTLLLLQIYRDALFLTQEGRTVLFLVTLVGFGAAYCLAVKRFHDRDRPALLAQLPMALLLTKMVLDLLHVTGDPWSRSELDIGFLVVQAAIGAWFIIELGSLRGTVGPNCHGPDPIAAAMEGSAGRARP